MTLDFIDLGDLLLLVAMLIAMFIVVIESVARRRETRRERTLLAAIDAEYRLYCRTGRL